MFDASRAVIAKQKCWPFGATRDGSITQTGKLYTGQQQEPSTTGLGLYSLQGAVQ